MTRPLSAEEMEYDISTTPRTQGKSIASEIPPEDEFWSTCMGKAWSEFPVEVITPTRPAA